MSAGAAGAGLAHSDRDGDVAVGFTDARLDVAESSAAGAAHLAVAVDALAGPSGAGGGAGIRTVRMHQVHGARVAVIGGDSGLPLEVGMVDGVDALVTAEPGVALVTRAADCVPVVLADPGAGVLGAVHAGRAGVVAQVVPAAVAAMRESGARRIRAWIGPAVCGGCYEVPADLREEVAATVPAARAETTWGTPSLDLVAGVRSQLAAHGVDEVVDLARCTREDPTLHSYRRDGAAAGRSAGIVVRTSPEVP